MVGSQSRRSKLRAPPLPYLYPLAIEGTPVDFDDRLADALFWRALDVGFPSARRLYRATFTYGAKVVWMPGLVWVPAAGQVPTDWLTALPSPDESDVRWLAKSRRRAARRWLRDQPPDAWPLQKLRGRPLRPGQNQPAARIWPTHDLTSLTWPLPEPV